MPTTKLLVRVVTIEIERLSTIERLSINRETVYRETVSLFYMVATCLVKSTLIFYEKIQKLWIENFEF